MSIQQEASVLTSLYLLINSFKLYLVLFLLLQPMFYHLGHFSKFVPPGSQRIEVNSSEETSLEFIGFLTPEINTVLVILNPEPRNITFDIIDQKLGIITETIPSYSIQTYIW